MAVPKLLTRLSRAITNSLYRATGGRVIGAVRGMPVLLITIAGRKTGAMHTNPLLYLEDDGKYVATGSGSGSAKDPQWFGSSGHSGRFFGIGCWYARRSSVITKER
jgi:F420H(2)-dependent quinone reductase